ncbi:MAG TPA: amidohydrolase family protein [Stenotrophomonas sp.]|nr:amidohydrolase family protein [Stenotrophomonas sp.]
MIIDAHQHYWRYDPDAYPWIGPGMDVLARDWLPGDYAPLRERHGVAATIAVQARSDEADTAWLLELARAHEWIAGVVGWIDLRADAAAARLAHWRAQGPLLGIRHQVQDEADPAAYLADAAFNRGVAAVQDAGLVYEVLLRHEQLHAAAAFCARHAAAPLVIDHLGKPDISGDLAAFARWESDMQALAALPHVSLKLSGLVTEADREPGGALDLSGIRRHLDLAYALFGADRLLFGSDWPVCQLAASFDEVLALARDWAAPLPEAQREAIFGGNARTIYLGAQDTR